MTTKSEVGNQKSEGIPNCGCAKCGHLACVCKIKREHGPKCAYRLAAAGPVGIECEHGYDTCPICDPCTCKNVVREWRKFRIVCRMAQLVVQYNIPTGDREGTRSGWMDHCERDPLPGYVTRALKELE